jgi:hypothetical protein
MDVPTSKGHAGREKETVMNGFPEYDLAYGSNDHYAYGREVQAILERTMIDE